MRARIRSQIKSSAQIGEAEFYVGEFSGGDAPKLCGSSIYFCFDSFKAFCVGFGFGSDCVGIFAELGKVLVQVVIRIELRKADVFQNVRRGLSFNPVTFHDQKPGDELIAAQTK